MRSAKMPLPRASSPLIILFMLMTLSTPVSAIYKDQAGKYDWHKQNIGDLKLARFVDNNILVASKNGVIASLRGGDGSVAWRFVLDTTEQITALEATAEVAVALTSSSYIRSFGPQGQMLWELYLPSDQDGSGSHGRCTAAQATITLVTDTTGKDKLLVSCDGSVNAYVLKTGISCSTEGTPSKTSSTAAKNEKITAKVVDAGLQITFPNGKKITDPSLKFKTVDGEVLDVAAAFAGSSPGQALIQLQEGTLASYYTSEGGGSNENVARWVRYEALASTVDFLFAELPAPTPENEAQWAAQQPTTSEALQMQLVALKAQVGLATPAETAAVERYRALTSNRLRPTRDPDGFRRQLVVTTASGKVLALHTGDGRVLWSFDFGAAAAPKKLAPWRTPHDILQDALIAAFRPVGKDLLITVINTHTGQVESEEIVQGDGADEAEVVPLGSPYHEDSADQHAYAVISSSQVVVVPRTEGARTAFAQQAQHIIHWRTAKDGSTISGIGFDSTGKERLLWTVDAAPKDSGMSILAVAARDPEERVYSAARPIPGGGIMLKHLSPNTLLVVAGKTPTTSSSTQNSRIIASVLDAVSGKVLFSQVHEGAAGPVHGIVSENWAAYHYWSVEMERWQIAVLDGYHPAPADLSVLDLALNRPAAANATATAVATTHPTFERQVFTTKLAVSTLGVTKTAHGTAAKMLLIGTTGGQVYTLDRRMLDPRRPLVPPGTKPTPVQIAENLPPYHPELAIAGPMYATMDRRVARLRAIATAPAVLESASLLVAVGLDVFYSRLQPSRGFDMVPDDFPHALLVAMVGGMAVALVVLKAVLQQRALKLKWQ